MLLLLHIILLSLDIAKVVLGLTVSLAILIALPVALIMELIVIPWLDKITEPTIRPIPTLDLHTSQLDSTVWHPSWPLYNFAFALLNHHISALPPHLRTKYSPYLRGEAFASIAPDLFADEPSALMREMGMEVDEASRTRARFLAALPEMVETGPEDGDRLPEPGQKGSAEKRWVEKGRLAAPKAVSREERQARKRRREERRRRREDERAREG